jgi:hypothetical protein
MPALADQLTSCWSNYRLGLLVDVSRALRLTRELYREELPTMEPTAAANATVELAMLDVIVGMVTADSGKQLLEGGRILADLVTDPVASCDDVHRIAALATAVHAGMRAGSFGAAEQHFRATLALAQGVIADDAGMVDVCTILGCAGLHLAQAAALARNEGTTRALLQQSEEAAEQLGIEHDVLGRYFGPEYTRATRAICLGILGHMDESLEVGQSVAMEKLMPLMAATLLRALAESNDRVEQRGTAAVLRARADRLVPPLRQQFD